MGLYRVVAARQVRIRAAKRSRSLRLARELHTHTLSLSVCLPVCLSLSLSLFVSFSIHPSPGLSFSAPLSAPLSVSVSRPCAHSRARALSLCASRSLCVSLSRLQRVDKRTVAKSQGEYDRNAAAASTSPLPIMSPFRLPRRLSEPNTKRNPQI